MVLIQLIQQQTADASVESHSDFGFPVQALTRMDHLIQIFCCSGIFVRKTVWVFNSMYT